MSKNIVQKFSASPQSTTYALLVGIDAYPEPSHRLRGCRNDVEAIGDFLDVHRGGRDLQLRCLLDQEASREQVIAAWLDFKVAKAGDVCLFYFSGHGSSGKSPPFFHHLDVNKYLQSIVCHDSRIPGGRDLTDKELSQLSWEVTFDKDQQTSKAVHLVTIFDCCHAGGNTKELERERGIDDGVIPEVLQEFYGFDAFDRQVLRGKVYYSPKRGPHLQMAAAGEKEKAKEMVIEGKPRGLYTYLLLEVLNDHQARLSYAQLQQALFARLQNATRQQTPQSDTLGILAKDHPFLLLTEGIAREMVIVSYQAELSKWIVHVGHIHGVKPQNLSAVQFYIPSTNSVHSLTEVYASHSALADFNYPDPNRVLLAEIREMGLPKISFAADDLLLDSLSVSTYSSPYFLWTKSEEKADYRLVQREDQVLTLQDGVCIHREAQLTTPSGIRSFCTRLERIAKWHQLLSIQNKEARIKPEQYLIEWFKQEGADAYPSEDQAPLQRLPAQAKSALFSYVQGKHYQRQRIDWLEPAFRLRFINRSGKPLYVAGLYLQADFKITDRFCQPRRLEPSQSIDFQYRTQKGRLYQSIFLSIYPELLQEGITHIKEYIKLFISYQPFDLQMFKQHGLYTTISSTTPKADPSKGIGRRTDQLLGGHRDWTVETLTLTIQKPET